MSSNPIYLFFASPASLAPTILRITLALLLFVEAYQALNGNDWPDLFRVQRDQVELAGEATAPAQASFAVVAIKMAAAFLLAAGFLTRFLALGLLTLLGFSLGWGDALTAQSFQINILLGAGLLALLLGGAGRWSLDRGISNILLPTVG